MIIEKIYFSNKNMHSRDILYSLALEADDPTILMLSLTSKSCNNAICKNQNFWRRKIERERPELLEFINFNGDYKELYRLLKETSDSITFKTSKTDKMKILGAAIGDLREEGEEFDLIDEYFEEYKPGDKIWIGIASDTINNFNPMASFHRGEIEKTILNEVSYILDSFEENGENENGENEEDQNIQNIGDIEFYTEKLRDTGYINVGGFQFSMKKVKLL